jgi:hypothetical protein
VAEVISANALGRRPGFRGARRRRWSRRVGVLVFADARLRAMVRRSARELDRLLGEIIGDLAQPLTEQDALDGWTEEAQRIWRDEFARLRRELAEGKEPRNWWNIMRGFDFGGYAAGRLATKANRIQGGFRDLFG